MKVFTSKYLIFFLVISLLVLTQVGQTNGSFGDFFKKIGSGISKAAQKVKTGFGSALNSTKNAFKGVGSLVGKGASSALYGIRSIFVNRDPNLIKFNLCPRPMRLENLGFQDVNSIKNSSYNPALPTKFIIHGFTPTFSSNGTLDMFDTIANAYFERGVKANYILVDWEALARPRGLLKVFHYGAAASNVPIAGRRVGEFIMFLKNAGFLELHKTHVIGFSLGAHVSGYAGQYVRNMTGGAHLLGRITGLDAAAPSFYIPVTKIENRLDPTDAVFVECLHTNIKVNGLLYPVGHVDFYPNKGGSVQPWCRENSLMEKISKIARYVCSHSSAYEYFAESIQRALMACPCNSTDNLKQCKHSWDRANGDCGDSAILFGARTPPTARGMYYLEIEAGVEKFSDKESYIY